MVFLPGRAKQDRTSTHNDTMKYNNSVKLQRAMHRGRARVNDFSRDPECTMAPDSRFDCARDKAVSQSECEQRGCCYAPGSDSAGPPWCFYPGLYRGYRMGPLMPTLHGLTATLTRAAPSYLPRDISVLQLDVTEEATDCLRITMKDPSSPRMNTTVAPLLFADQYLQLSTMLASHLVSGLGQHYSSLLLDINWTTLALWNRDMAPHPDANLYGSHPFYIVQEGDGMAHGVFLLNSNAIGTN
ncbi:hypothetical protein fugu_015509 [Takifugu bimaculatus]|uniref:P-type domain-containing protein n=1 Tax=Takifugu bimaculatus TaxID=433685 RepID=A0A4Z2BYZ7_9TELE|nr:hypothetical protein fugu_015509 [Takifugu bimaculatus]